ncbi:hypothetical protein [Mucilaginibacter ginsenosidivorans]
MVIFQAVFFYYYTSGLEKLLFLAPYALLGLILTIVLLIKLIKYRSTTLPYHVIAVTLVVVTGYFTTIGGNRAMEYLDWTLRRTEREQIIIDVKNGLLKPNNLLNNRIYHLSRNSILPISNGGDNILIKEKAHGIVSVEFFIDRGSLGHFSAFIYTNDPAEIREYNSGIDPFGGGNVKKLGNSWYRVSY